MPTRPGDKYVSILGADVARQCLEAGELDEVLTLIAPVLLGDVTRWSLASADRHAGHRNGWLRTLTASA